jgi:hypothetical protein
MLAVYQVGQKKYLLLDQSHPLYLVAIQAKTFTQNEIIKKWIVEQTQDSEIAPWIQLAKTHIIRFKYANKLPQLRSLEQVLDQMHQPPPANDYLSHEDVLNFKYNYLYPSWHHILSTVLIILLVALAPVLHQYLGAQFSSSFIFFTLILSTFNFYANPVSISIQKTDITPTSVGQLLKSQDASSFQYSQVPESTHSQSPLDASRPGHSL